MKETIKKEHNLIFMKANSHKNITTIQFIWSEFS